MIRSTEDTLRTRLINQVAWRKNAAPVKPPEPVIEK